MREPFKILLNPFDHVLMDAGIFLLKNTKIERSYQQVPKIQIAFMILVF